MTTLFHLAFPVHDLSETKTFYHDLLEFELGRVSSNALILHFGGHQIVAHLCEESLPIQSGIYPRHFGLIFLELEKFNQFIQRIEDKKIPFYLPVKTRFQNTKIEHQSFFLKDPSNNLLEFKYYSYQSAIFGETSVAQIGDAGVQT